MARAEGDIVITVGGNVSPLTDAVTKAERTLGKLNTATQRADKQFRAMVGTSTEMQARIDALSGVTDRLGKSAERSAEAFAAFDRSKAAVDRLRASYDPLFAASKRYEAAVEQLDTALLQGVVTQKQYAAMVEKLGRSMLTGAGQATAAGAGLKSVSTRGAETANVFAQLNDVGMMAFSGQSPFMLAIQQGSQLNQVWAGMAARGAGARDIISTIGQAAMGMVSPMSLLTLGTIAGGAALMQWGLSALTTSEDVAKLEDRLAELESAVSRFTASLEASRKTVKELTEDYGRFGDEMQRILVALAEGDQRVALAKIRSEIDAIGQSLLRTVTAREALVDGTSTRQLIEDFGRLPSQVGAIEAALNALETARGLDAQIQAALRLMNALDSARDSAGNLPKPLEDAYTAATKIAEQAVAINTKIRQMEGYLDAAARAAAGTASAVDGIGSAASGAVGEVAKLAGAMWDLAHAQRAAEQNRQADSMVYGEVGARGDPRTSNTKGYGEFDRPTVDDYIEEYNKKNRGGGGGKKGEDYAKKLEQFNQGLMTEAELELAQYQTRQEQLQAFLDGKLLTQEEYNAKLEQLQQQHSDRMAAIDVYRYGDGLQKAGAFLGDMASALQGGNEKMQKIAAKFAAVETLINAWRAYSQTLADPTLPFWAKIPAAMKVLAAGFGAVNAIKGGGGGGGGAATSKPAAAAVGPAQAPLEVRLRGDGSAIGWGDLGTLLTKLNEEAGDRGYRLLVAP